MNATFLHILHWVLNIALMLACVACVLFGIFGQGQNITVFDRVMTEVVAVGFGFLAFMFTKTTLKQG